MHEMTSKERTIKAMNFEPVNGFPIMMNWLPWKYVVELTGVSDDEYWESHMSTTYSDLSEYKGRRS